MSESVKKLEKIASALYLITSFFDDKEPLKWRLRSLSISLVSEDIRDKSMVAKEMHSLFSVAKNAGLVSEMNHDILSKELSKLENEGERSLNTLYFGDRREDEKALPQLHELKVIKDKIVDRASSIPVLREFGVVSVKKNSRQSIIIGILKRKKEIMIKDVSPLITGCSEKTIQRELSAMVAAGILRKVGEKRWSRYTLA